MLMMSENTDHGLCSLARITCCVVQDDDWWVLIVLCDVWEFWFKKHIQLQTKCRYRKWSNLSLYLYFLLMKNIINITYNKKDRFRLALSSSSKEVIGQLDALWGRWRYLTSSFYFFSQILPFLHTPTHIGEGNSTDKTEMCSMWCDTV